VAVAAAMPATAAVAARRLVVLEVMLISSYLSDNNYRDIFLYGSGRDMSSIIFIAIFFFGIG
jgi:hypothetical protein